MHCIPLVYLFLVSKPSVVVFLAPKEETYFSANWNEGKKHILGEIKVTQDVMSLDSLS